MRSARAAPFMTTSDARVLMISARLGFPLASDSLPDVEWIAEFGVCDT